MKLFSGCLSMIYRVCCSCCYKRQQRKREDKQKQRQTTVSRSKTNDSIEQDETVDETWLKYSTIGQLTNAAVVVEPPPAFARYMLRKSVDRLNSEVCHCFDCHSFFIFNLLISSFE